MANHTINPSSPKTTSCSNTGGGFDHGGVPQSPHDQAADETADLRSDLEYTHAKLASAEEELGALKAENEGLKKELEGAAAKLEASEAKLAATESKLKGAEAKLKKQKDE